VKLGEFDQTDGVPGANDPYGKIGREVDTPPWERETSKELARRATAESVVLLKNEAHILPLDAAKLKTIAVIGPWADEVLLDWYSGTPPYSVSSLKGIREAAGKGAKVIFASGDDPAATVDAARKSDVAIVVVGNHPYCNATHWDECGTPSNGREDVDRRTIVLEQEALVKLVYAANPNTVEVLISSFPYAIVWSQQHIPAILHLTHNSEELGHGLADVLFGKVSPAGRLAQTWPTGDEQLLPMLDYDLLHGSTYLYNKQKPLYPFGYGLSYTDFAYEKLGVSATEIPPDGQVEVSVQVKNTGSVDSHEVVQIYVQHLGSAVDRPLKELKGFNRVVVKAGQTADVKLTLKARDLAYWDALRHAWRVEKEPVKIWAGGSSDNLPVSAVVNIRGTGEFKP